jgi:hypothetical protein
MPATKNATRVAFFVYGGCYGWVGMPDVGKWWWEACWAGWGRDGEEGWVEKPTVASKHGMEGFY